jgi:phage shock protein PspC (stress-responsive transcriptional regulator)
MNKTISINISGFAFNIEEQAYKKLADYLNSIKNNFKEEKERDEIMEDIEARIAEIFQENLSDRKEVILLVDVARVIEVMGKPEDYISDEASIEDHFTDSKESDSNQSSSSKRLYRDESEAKLGGVCAGLGHYFNIDPVLVRIIFILLVLFGAGFLLYIILWVVIPGARTTSQILEMKGQNITLDNIKEHVKDVKTAIVDNTKGAKNNITNAVNKGVVVGSKIGRIIGKIIGFVFIVGSILSLLSIILVFFGNSTVLPLFGNGQSNDLTTLLGLVYPEGRLFMFFIASCVFILIPTSFFMYIGSRLLFNLKRKFMAVRIVFTVLWILSIGTLIIIHLELGLNLKEREQVDYEVALNSDTTNVLFVDVIEDDVFSKYIEFNKVWNFTELINVKDEITYFGYPNVEITQKEDSSDFKVILHKESNGFSKKDAIQRAEKIEYKINVENGKLLLSPYFSINTQDKFRGQLVTVEIQIPYGKQVVLGENINRIMVDVNNNYYNHIQDYDGTTWEVDDYKELRCKGCKVTKYKYYQYND